MAEFNSCASLLNDKKIKEASDKYDELLKDGKDPFELILKMQHDLQKALFKKNTATNDVDNLNTLGVKYDWLRDNKIALDDEFREIIDALPGMNTPDKERSAIWKKWKAKYNEIRSKSFDDLTEDELKELRFEYIDMLHFVFNMSFPLNISSKDIFVYYYYKNIENFRRCQEGY